MINTFIGTSREYLEICNKLVKELDEVLKKKTGLQFNFIKWCNAFNGGDFTLNTLLKYTSDCQCAIFILSPDDFAKVRKQNYFLPRDNVLFESGLFMGKLGTIRTCLIKVDEEKIYKGRQLPLRILSDIEGLTILSCFVEKENGCIRITKLEDLVERIYNQLSGSRILLNHDICNRIDRVATQITVFFNEFLFKDYLAEKIRGLKDEPMISSSEMEKLLDQIECIENYFQIVSKIIDADTAEKSSTISDKCIFECEKLFRLTEHTHTLSPSTTSFLKGYSLFRQYDSLWYKSFYIDRDFLNGQNKLSEIRDGLTEVIQLWGIGNNCELNARACLTYIHNLICTYTCKYYRLSRRIIDDGSIDNIKKEFDRILSLDESLVKESNVDLFQKSRSQHLRSKAFFYADCAIKKNSSEYKKEAMETFRNSQELYLHEYKTYEGWIKAIIQIVDGLFHYNYFEIARAAENDNQLQAAIETAVKEAGDVLNIAKTYVPNETNRWAIMGLNIEMLKATHPEHRDSLEQCINQASELISNARPVDKYTLQHLLQLIHYSDDHTCLA